MQTCLTSAELVKVPTGHGRKKSIVSLPPVFLNPDAKRVEIKVFVNGSLPPLTVSASSSEF